MPHSSGELGEAPWGCQGALGDLLGLSSAALGHLLEEFHVILGFSERPQGFPGCLMGAIGCLGGENYPNLDARQCKKLVQAGDCVLRQNLANTDVFLWFSQYFGFGGEENLEIAASGFSTS